MAGLIGSGVSLQGHIVRETAFPWLVSGTVVAADVGKPVQQDTAAANTVKLAVEDAVIIGQLASFENRVQEGIKIGTVYHHGGFKFDYTGSLAVGDKIVGSATAGKVKKAPVVLLASEVLDVNATPTPDQVTTTAVPAAPYNRSMVVEVNSGAGTCVVLFL